MVISSRIRVLICDDSGFMRVAIRKMLETDEGIEVVAEARNGKTAVTMAKELRPDVITMDVEMPEMDGLKAAEAIMAECPTPIIMVSSLTQAGADTTVRALSIGAVDFISKSSSFVQLDIVQIDKELRAKIHHWGKKGGFGVKKPRLSSQPPPTLRRVSASKKIDIVVVGVSTGGPRLFPKMLHSMGRLDCPIAVAQHMPELYTKSFAQHLAQDTGLNVREGENNQELIPGSITILPGGISSVVIRGIGGKMVLSTRRGAVAPIHPSADMLFESVLRVADNPLAVILTGMGSDGTEGAKRFAEKGLSVIVQTPDDCVVGGMPQAAINAGAVSQVLKIEEIGQALKKLVGA